MSTFLWSPPADCSDANGLKKAVDVMRAMADLLEVSDCDDNIQFSRAIGKMMTDLLNSAADLTIGIANEINSKMGGNVHHCKCCDGGKAS